jgi:hypothetical protein
LLFNSRRSSEAVKASSAAATRFALLNSIRELQ